MGFDVSGDLVCQECGGDNPIWFTDNDVWNRVMGGPDQRDDPGGVLCPPCFIAAAERVHGQRAWKLSFL